MAALALTRSDPHASHARELGRARHSVLPLCASEAGRLSNDCADQTRPPRWDGIVRRSSLRIMTKTQQELIPKGGVSIEEDAPASSSASSLGDGYDSCANCSVAFPFFGGLLSAGSRPAGFPGGS